MMAGIGGRQLALLCALSGAAMPALAADATDTSAHRAEIAALAAMIADLRTAAQRYPGLAIDETRAEVERLRLHVASTDYFAYRKIAHDRADALVRSLLDPDALRSWCDLTLEHYGPNETIESGVLAPQ